MLKYYILIKNGNVIMNECVKNVCDFINIINSLDEEKVINNISSRQNEYYEELYKSSYLIQLQKLIKTSENERNSICEKILANSMNTAKCEGLLSVLENNKNIEKGDKYPDNKQVEKILNIKNQIFDLSNERLFLKNKLNNIDQTLIILKRRRNDNAHEKFFLKHSLKNFKFYYRGQYGDFPLLPKVLRDIKREENFYYHEIMVRCAKDFMGLSHLDKLVMMQHYGCPTRLLDITTNPLVALYFACKNFKCKKCDNKKNGYVYIFAIEEQNICYMDSDRAMILSCLSKFKNDDRQKLLELCRQYLLLKRKFDENCNEEIVNKFIYEIRRENPSFIKNINPQDLLNPIIVQPSRINTRILRQDGAFILSGLSSSRDDEIRNLDVKVYDKIQIGENDEDMKNILKELDKLGINEASLFPEVDKVAEYLVNNF